MSTSKQNTGNIMQWLTAVLLIGGVAILTALYWTQNVTVQDVKVNELEFTSYEDIKQAAAVPKGIKPDSLDLEALTSRVEQLNFVQTAIPYVEPNGNLRLRIKERQPLALLISGPKRRYVDADGVKLPILEGKTRDVPLLYGYSTNLQDTLQGESFTQIRDFLLHAKASDFGWATISEIAFDKADGVVALSHENGVKLLFGRNDFDIKLENWKAFYTQVVKTKGIDAMRQIDLRFTNQVVTREI